MREHPHEYILENITVATLTNPVILKHSAELLPTDKRGFYDIQPQVIEIGSGLFMNTAAPEFPEVTVSQTESALILSCACNTPKRKLCEHQVQVLYNLKDREYLRIYFDAALRETKLKQAAKDYGLENEKPLDDFFEVIYTNKAFEIRPRIKELIPVNTVSTTHIKEQLLPEKTVQVPAKADEHTDTKMLIIFGKHKYYEQFTIELYEAKISKDGKVKNPLTAIEPLQLIWKTEKVDEIKFYTGISRFQGNFAAAHTDQDIDVLKLIVNNPLKLDVFYHNSKAGEKVQANSIVRTSLDTLKIDLKLSVDLRKKFYEVSGELIGNDTAYPLKTLNIKYDFFVEIDKKLHLITNPDFLRVIDFFKKNNQKILIHESKYEEFRQNILAPLEHLITIKYSYIKSATEAQIEEKGFNQETEKIIYLTEQENYVALTPVIKYGNAEIPVFSRKQIYDTDQNGNVFQVERNEGMELQFTSILIRQHEEFEEQLQNKDSLYLHKDKFLDEEWFLSTFEEWEKQNITILGFNGIKNNRLNYHKAVISVNVSTGIDWFKTDLTVKFGDQNVLFSQLHKAIRNKNKFVQLDDGTLGVLPDEWLKKFAEYFQKGEVFEDHLRTPKSNFYEVSNIYEEDFLADNLKAELEMYAIKFAHFENIEEIPVPETLQATLRDYQKQGLNWLNFLDDFNFGACLADDMGLGKTIQIIAFILSQRSKRKHNTNLVVVPTSLLFNWQAEVAKFAPSIKMYTHYGMGREKNTSNFGKYEIILTTYGMLLSDIHFLRDYSFNYIFLDESQAIKNPDSQRYKAARMLQSRNKVVLTGTPVENNTFDLYGQLSFACPGLLGNKAYFNDVYSVPIDKFADKKRAKELQKRINPFILRRTKKQVATELPEKTEMVIYCEMGAEQRKVYDACEKDIRDYLASQTEEQVHKSSMYVLKGILRLRQICNSPSILKDDEFYGDFSSKIDVLMEQIENKSPQHKILVFSQFVSMLDLIKTELQKRNIPFEYLTGQTRNRAAKVNAFQENEEVRVFLISLKAGGTGLNLTEADYVYLVDPWWNPAVENQAIDRSYRIGQKKNVIAVRLICPDTIEEKMMELQQSKTKLADDLVKTDAAILKSLSKKELMGIFS